jgi:formylglycine-generating enzyme required for sulfatase activity
MIQPSTADSRLALFLIVLTASLYQCSPSMPFNAKNHLGDTKERQGDEMTMVFVPSGEFLMGIDYLGMRYAFDLCKTGTEVLGPGVCQGPSYANEMPAHPVTLDGFWIDQTEVTNRQYGRCVEEQVCSQPSETNSFTRESYFNDTAFSDYPVVWVTRDQAAEYCSWAGGRLPTEAEWEYAARGPDSLTFPWGADFDPSRLYYCDASCAYGVIDPSYDDGFPETAPVGSFPNGASWIGALDMAGNVREWVNDWFAYYTPDPQVNPDGPEEGSTHIPKGGSWLDRPDDLRSSNRGENTPDYTRHKVGFRCVMEMD